MTANHKIRLGVLISGSGTNLQAIIDAAEKSRIGAALAVVISDNPEAAGLVRAKKHRIPAVVVEREEFPSREAFEEEIVAELRRHEVELVCMAGFMRIIGRTLLGAFRDGIINIHPALLPSFRGLDAQRKALEYGVKIAGCTVHFVDEKPDHGPIIRQAVVEVNEDDTPETLRLRILKEEHKIYPEVIGLIAQGRVRIEGRRVRIE